MNPMFSDNAAFAVNFLQEKGWTPHAAVGVVGNLIQESGPNLNTRAVHDGGTGIGIAGFRDPKPGQGRKTNLMNFARQNELDPFDLRTQLSFVDHELRTSEAGVGARLRAARNAEEAARAGISYFRPAGWTANNPTAGHGWNNRLRNAVTLSGAPMPVGNYSPSRMPNGMSAPTPPPREQMLAAREGANPLVSFASLGGGGDPQPAPAQAPMAFAPSGNSGGMQPLPVRLESGDDGLPTAMQGIQASFGGGMPFAPQGGNDPMSAMMAALSQPKPLRETLGLVDELIGGSADSNELDPMEVASSDEDGGGLLGGLFGTRTDAATIQEPEIDARPIFNDGGMSQDEYDRVRGRTEARMRREQPNMVNNFVDNDGVEAAELAMTGGMGDADAAEPVGLLDLPRGNNGLFGEDPLGNTTIDAVRGSMTPFADMAIADGAYLDLTPRGQAQSPQPQGSGLAPVVPQAALDALGPAPELPPPQEVATMPQPFEAPMPQPAMQPQQPPLDPNAWSGGDWIPPDIGMQLAQAQMRGGVPQADMPMQGAATAQGVPQAPQQPAQAEQLPAPPPGGMGGVAPVAQPQQAAQAPAQAPAPSGEPSPMRQAFADMLGAVGQSLMETGNLSGMGRAMQAMQLASSNRRKSAEERRALVSVLMQAGVPEAQANEISVNPQIAKMGFDIFMQTRAQQATQQFNERANSVFNGGGGGSEQPASGAPVDAQQPAPSTDGAQPAPAITPNQARLDRLKQQEREFVLMATDPANGDRVKPLLEQVRKDIERTERAMGGTSKFFGNVIWGTDENGNEVPIQISDTGEAQAVPLPEGVRPSAGTRQVDAGTHFVILDRSGNAIGIVPKNNRESAFETAAGTVEGRTAAEKVADAPRAVVQADLILSDIDALINDPGLDNAVGWGSYVPFDIPGFNAETRARLNKLEGQAFLQAFESLKGGGQITEIEGVKATQAIARLGRAQDPNEFRQALREFKEVIDAARMREARRLPGGEETNASGGSDTPAPRRMRYNPETGELE
jgi:hypothetical protein